jgi:hypothetical protein
MAPVMLFYVVDNYMGYLCFYVELRLHVQHAPLSWPDSGHGHGHGHG